MDCGMPFSPNAEPFRSARANNNTEIMKPKTSKVYLSLGLGLATALGVFLCQPAKASILWDGDASHGTSVFGSLNIENNPGTITVVTDAQQGQVFRMICYDNGSTKVRTEGSRMRNFQPLAGQTYWFGWKHKWGPLPTKCGKWQVLEQIHLSGTGAAGGPVPFGLHVDGCDANMEFEYQKPSGTAVNFLVMPLPLNSWHSFMYHEKWSTSESDGYVEFWYDGTMKTLANGQTRYPAAWCFPNSTSYWKWGIYRSGSGGPIGTSYAYLWRPRAGTTQADVDPGGGGGGGGNWVQVKDRNSGKVAAVQSASMDNGAAVILWTFGSAENDQWELVPTDSGYVKIVNRHSSKVMAVQSASKAERAAVIQWTMGSALNDHWQKVDSGGGYFRLVNRKSGKVLTVRSGGTSNGTVFEQRTWSGATYQQFTFPAVP